MAGFFDGEKHGPALAGLVTAGVAAMQDDRAPQDIGRAVKQSALRAWGIIAATLLVTLGVGLILAGGYLALEPLTGAAAALVIMGLIPLATGGGLFLVLRNRSSRCFN